MATLQAVFGLTIFFLLLAGWLVILSVAMTAVVYIVSDALLRVVEFVNDKFGTNL